MNQLPSGKKKEKPDQRTNHFKFTRTQLTFNCPKSTIKTLEKDVKYVQN